MPVWLIIGIVFLVFWNRDERRKPPVVTPSWGFTEGAPMPWLSPGWKPPVIHTTTFVGYRDVPVSPGAFQAGGTVNDGQRAQPTNANALGFSGADYPHEGMAVF